MDLALFDFDGTITDAESFPAFVRRAVPRSRLWIGSVLLAPLILAYRAGLISGTVVRAQIVRFAFRGAALQPVVDAGRAFAEEWIPARLRSEAMQRIAWHRARGDQVVVVSGAFDLYLAEWCRQHDLALVCSRLESIGEHLTGRYAGAQCVGAEKVQLIQRLFPRERYAQVHAYGDTVEDLAMLELADQRWYRGQLQA
jgi:phosphatidylglycerophosphatase C